MGSGFAPVLTLMPSQTAGISPTPKALQNVSALRNWYGDAVHVIAYPVDISRTSWAITLPETQEASESWKLYSKEETEHLKSQLKHTVQAFDRSVSDLVQSSERIVKFGLFDRPELPPEQWHSERCVLVGDAAHPTSPHLGQGANQALSVNSHSQSWYRQD
jgi:salicylate hydroxylase